MKERGEFGAKAGCHCVGCEARRAEKRADHRAEELHAAGAKLKSSCRNASCRDVARRTIQLVRENAGGLEGGSVLIVQLIAPGIPLPLEITVNGEVARRILSGEITEDRLAEVVATIRSEVEVLFPTLEYTDERRGEAIQ